MKKFFLLLIVSFTFADSLVVLSVGDVMFANHGVKFLDNYGLDYPYKYIKQILNDADIRICNLEAAISDTGKPFDKKYVYRIANRHANVVKNGLFDVVCLSNNHMLDFGKEALFNTIRILDSLKIGHTGAGKDIFEARKPCIINKKGKLIGFLSYSNTFPEEFWADSTKAGTAFGHAYYIKEDIKKIREKCDLVFVSFHWGSEGMKYPKDYQKELARLAVDCGADGVFGHHPHVLQGIEIYKKKPIAYSLGNFLFSTWTNNVWDSIILKAFYEGNKFIYAEIIPVLVNNFKVEMQTRPLKGKNAIKSLNDLSKISDTLGTRIEIKDSLGYIYP